MAKLTKTEAIEQAKILARNDERVKSVTLRDLEGMDYDARLLLARSRCVEAQVALLDTQPRYIGEAEQAFVDAAMGVWGAKERELRNRRDAWKRALSGLSCKQAEAKVLALLREMNIRGMRLEQGYFGSFEVTRSWGAGVTLYVRFDRDLDVKGIENPDAPEQRAFVHDVRVEVSWSSTTRSLSESELALKVYREVLDAAHEIKAVMDRERIVSTWGVPAPTTAVEAPEQAQEQPEGEGR